MPQNKQAIKDYAIEREIPYLVHFTNVENLPSIIDRKGLISVTTARNEDITMAVNDSKRLDECLDYISLSIAFPNSELFNKWQRGDKKWAILLLNHSILWEKDCVFCQHNAAKKYISTQSIEYRQTVEAFKKMYDQIIYYKDWDKTQERYTDAHRSRESQPGLASYDPTHVQAEVLVPKVIELAYILRIIFQDDDTYNDYNDRLKDKSAPPSVIENDFFKKREDAR